MPSEADAATPNRARWRGSPCGRRAALFTAALALVAICAPTLTRLPLRLIWNVTASAPIGFYRIDSSRRFATGDLVVVAPTQQQATFLDQRGYLPHGVPLLKRIAASPGQTVCRDGLTIIIDGRILAAARERDSQGRDLPAWAGCRQLAESEVFLMNAGVADSIDGRYFGPTAMDRIIGIAHPLWTPH
ncbi:MAG: S26 family signal peptidase [Alphaproteobacteria bacterium]|nr:S26 family signal peptidase [Alphaproteobacteria bacterium]